MSEHGYVSQYDSGISHAKAAHLIKKEGAEVSIQFPTWRPGATYFVTISRRPALALARKLEEGELKVRCAATQFRGKWEVFVEVVK